MRIKVLKEDRFCVVATMQGNDCPAEAFLREGEANTKANRIGLIGLLERVAAEGLGCLPSALKHEVDKSHGIHEFIKGRLRLFFFEGTNGQVAVCTGGVMKSGQRADKAAVAHAIACKKAYFEAKKSQTLEVIQDEDQ